MNPFERPTFFYLFPSGSDIKIEKMTDVDGGRLWDQGQRWLDVPHKTLADAQEVRKQLLSSRQAR